MGLEFLETEVLLVQRGRVQDTGEEVATPPAQAENSLHLSLLLTCN